VAVIALAFPLHPPGKALQVESSRAGELRSAGVPVLVINGDRDPFGVPDAADTNRLVVLAGQTHALSGAKAAITSEVSSWLAELAIGSVSVSSETGVGKSGRQNPAGRKGDDPLQPPGRAR